jgi:LPS sulfotransferase NodH
MTPRSGSSFLCDALKATDRAGRPEEYYLAEDTPALLERYAAGSAAEAQATILKQGTTPNGVFGVKLSTGRGGLEQLVELLAQAAEATPGGGTPAGMQPLQHAVARMRAAFPDLRFVFLTRRNKVRQAVSWWKAIQTDQWILRAGDGVSPSDGLEYTFAAIDSLLQQAVLREAGWQAVFEAAQATPVTVAYEDLLADFGGAMRRVLDGLGLADVPVPSNTPSTRQQADALSEAWVERFRIEKQEGWTNAGWDLV